MSKSAVGLVTLVIYAGALVMAPSLTPARAETSGGKHIKKHKRVHRSPVIGNAWLANQAWPNDRSYRQPSVTCSRSFECAKWPPPFDEDPDRKASGTDQ